MKKIYISLLLILTIILGAMPSFAIEDIPSGTLSWNDSNKDTTETVEVNTDGHGTTDTSGPTGITVGTEPVNKKNNSNNSNNKNISQNPIGPTQKDSVQYIYKPKKESIKYASFWYIYDMNSKETERDFVRIFANDSTKFTHTFDKLGSYVVQRIDAYWRYDWNVEEKYVLTPSLNIDPDTGEPIIKWEYELDSTQTVQNNLTLTQPTEVKIVADNGVSPSGGLRYFHSGSSRKLDDGTNMYQKPVLNTNNKWYVHVVDPPLTWTEGDGNTEVGGWDVDTELVK